MSLGYQRDFMILDNEDSGYEAGRKPTGYLKIEVREGKGKLEASIQNLRRSDGSFEYKIYLIRDREGGFAPVCAGKLKHGLNKAELSWSFDPRNVAMSGYKINEFDIGAVIVEYIDRKTGMVICPLAAYKNKRTEWRKSFNAQFIQKTPFAPSVNEKQIFESAEAKPGLSETKENANSTKPEFNAAYEEVGQAMPEENYCDEDNYYNDNVSVTDEIIKDIYEKAEKAGKAEAAEEPEEVGEAGDNKVDWEVEETAALENSEEVVAEQKAAEKEPMGQVQLKEEEKKEYPNYEADQWETGSGMDEKASNNIDTNCIYLNANICGAFINSAAGSANPCDGCQIHKVNQPSKKVPGGDVVRLREELGRFFELSDPFNSRRTDYTWWRVTNPVNLNNILYQCNIRSPLLFNPAVMMAHYRYRHLIIGIFHHKDTQKQYVVCGVPGMNMVDRKPFGDAGRWVQVEGSRPRYGAFGYWIVYIDPDDGRILTI